MVQYGLPEEIVTQLVKVRDIPPYRGEIYDRYIENDMHWAVPNAANLFINIWRTDTLTVQQMIAEFNPMFAAGVEGYKKALQSW
jgi:hypothetical protein